MNRTPIKSAWYKVDGAVSRPGQAPLTVALCDVFCLTESGDYYRREFLELADPRAFVEKIKRKGTIDPALWTHYGRDETPAAQAFDWRRHD